MSCVPTIYKVKVEDGYGERLHHEKLSINETTLCEGDIITIIKREKVGE